MPHANRVQGVEASTGGGLASPGTSGADRSNLVARRFGEVDAELARVRGTALLVEWDRIGRFGLFALLVAIGANAWGFVRYGDRYMLMWVVASLYFYMFYWILPLVYGVALALLHREESGDERPAPEPKRLIRSVKEARLLRFKGRLIAVGWNVWFLGGVSMTAGYLAIFSIDILYALIAGFVYRGLAMLTVVLVVAQSAGIILYYLAVYLLWPYSTDFSAWLSALMRGRRERREQGRSGLAPTALLAALSFMLAVLLVIAILFPGHTLDRILPVNQLWAVGYQSVPPRPPRLAAIDHAGVSQLAEPIDRDARAGLERTSPGAGGAAPGAPPAASFSPPPQPSHRPCGLASYRDTSVPRHADPSRRPVHALPARFRLPRPALAQGRQAGGPSSAPSRTEIKKGVTGIRGAEPLSAGRP